jgi:hypothetical protein
VVWTVMDRGSDTGAQYKMLRMESWLLTVTQLPTEDPAARMRFLRTLESLGAAVLREGAYLLPDTPGNRQSLDALAEYIGKMAGAAHVMQVTARAPAQQDQFKRLFDRSARYESLVKTIESLRVGFGQTDPGAIARVLGKQRREFETIAALDFFPTQSRTRVEQILADSETAVKNLTVSRQPQAALPEGEALLRRTWVTRKPVWADRLACAWLVRRFVDPEATLAWLDKAQATPAGSIGFAFDGAHFAAGQARIAYEEILARTDLAKNAALAKIGSIVHFLEMGGDPVPEAAGVQTLLQGAGRRAQNEDELLGEAEKTFDLLYEAYFDPAKQ